LIKPIGDRLGSYYVRLDDRKLVAITGITETGFNTYTAEFTWRWVPTAVAAGLGGPEWNDHFGSVMRATAIIRRYDDGWRVADFSDMHGLVTERVQAEESPPN
jgi:hypothetical protein